MCAGSWARVQLGDRSLAEPRCVTTPSWSSTGLPSAVSQTSLSRPVAPRRSPSANASRVFSRRVGPGTSMGEGDRVAEDRGESLLHGADHATAGRRCRTLRTDQPRPPRLPPVFNFSGSEIVFLLLLALIVLGPEKLPDAVRKFGKTYAEFKKMTTGFQSELKSALDEPMREMRDTADAFKKAASFDFDAEPDADRDSRAAEATPIESPTTGRHPAARGYEPAGHDRPEPLRQSDAAIVPDAPVQGGARLASRRRRPHRPESPPSPRRCRRGPRRNTAPPSACARAPVRRQPSDR